MQQVQKNARRQARNDKPPYEALDDLNRSSERCRLVEPNALVARAQPRQGGRHFGFASWGCLRSCPVNLLFSFDTALVPKKVESKVLQEPLGRPLTQKAGCQPAGQLPVTQSQPP